VRIRAQLDAAGYEKANHDIITARSDYQTPSASLKARFMRFSRFEVIDGDFAAAGCAPLPLVALAPGADDGDLLRGPFDASASGDERGVGTTRRLGAAATSLKSPTRPSREAACTAHPRAMASSGFTVRRGVTPVDAFTRRPMNGMRTAPPTSTTLFNRWAYTEIRSERGREVSGRALILRQ